METLFHILVSNALLAAVPALLAFASARLLKRPALTHALWLLALLKLVTPPVLDVPLRLLPARERLAASEPAPVAPVTEMSRAPARPSAAAPEDRGSAPTVVIPGVEQPVPGAAQSFVSWQAIVGGLWVIGAGLTLGLTLMRLRRFNRLLRLATPASRAVQAQADQVARHLGARRSPAVAFVPGALSPMLWAVGVRPRLLLPAALWARLGAAQQVSLLAHELAHFRRRDHWVRYLEMAASVLYWWHPLVWLGRRELRAAEEQCCDAWVVDALPEHARAYATALLDTVDFISDSRPVGTVPLAATGAVGASNLKRRLVMIMSAANPKSLSSLGRIAVLGLGLVLLPAVPKLATADDAPAPRAGERPRGDAEKPREGERPREGVDRPREGGDRPRGDAERAREPERAQVPLDTAGVGTFVRLERGAVLLSDDANDKDVRVGVKDGTKVSVDGRAASVRELRAGMMVKATTVDGVTTLEATRPRWLKTLNPPGREGERPRGEAERPREGERPREDVERPRGEPERPHVEGERPRENADRPRGEPERPRAEGERPREADVRGEPRRGEREPVALAAGRPLRGVFDKLDGTSIVLGLGDNGGPRVVPTDENTKVTLNGQPAKLADLQAGMYVEVKQVEGLTTEVSARAGRR